MDDATEQTTVEPVSRGPLTGVRVLELAGLGPAQLGGMLLGDLGAEVIRVDRPSAVPMPPGDPATEVLSRGRRSLVVDLKRPEGVELALQLAETVDVLFDPYRPGVTERLGLGPEAVLERSPGVIYARMTGWGQTGPLARTAGHDINYIALVGALHQIGEPEAPPPVPLNLVGDFGGGGMLLAFAVCAALVERARSGRGQIVDVAMIDGVASLMTSIFQLDAGGQWQAERGTDWLQGGAPWYRAYETSDGRFVTIGTLEPQFYVLLMERLGLSPADWPQWDRRVWPRLRARLEALFRTRTLAAWTEELEGTDACFAPALTFDEVLGHPHLASRHTYVRRDGVVQPGPVPRFGRTPGVIGGAPPRHGQDTVAILTELGTTTERREALLDQGIVAQAVPQAGRA